MEVEYVPAPHRPHCTAALPENEPGRHCEHPLEFRPENVPLPQATHALEPARDIWPAGQIWHVEASVATSTADTVPPGQTEHWALALDPIADE